MFVKPASLSIERDEHGRAFAQAEITDSTGELKRWFIRAITNGMQSAPVDLKRDITLTVTLKGVFPATYVEDAYGNGKSTLSIDEVTSITMINDDPGAN